MSPQLFKSNKTEESLTLHEIESLSELRANGNWGFFHKLTSDPSASEPLTHKVATTHRSAPKHRSSQVTQNSTMAEIWLKLSDFWVLALCINNHFLFFFMSIFWEKMTKIWIFHWPFLKRVNNKNKQISLGLGCRNRHARSPVLTSGWGY